ncbi:MULTISPECIES: D-alanyl-D-alanine carboxypeptidase family protein [Pacificimonas]|uniref:serine-type D-Ala-D-Ala carboxypeptidase n=1 Tax=Pacificimonas aurantium TaxID=1250540 RepID=A0ABS7WLS5_9SPHN|nr:MULTISPECIES: D-alanyl-D-alanine carboxypeptidase family protein [Pacificimonas]MBZ6378573.1 D-alanyl-D-alanine carboxypeptidase [Pacificimonas aurantium]
MIVKTRFAAILAASSLALGAALPAGGQSFDSRAPFAYLKDIGADIVLYSDGADEPMPPASMAKMMTVLVAFDQIDKGRLALDDTCTVRPDTWRQWSNQGSTMFLKVNSEPTVEQLLDGIVTASGNDASVVLAECIAGTVPAFADAMNSMGEEIGLTGSNFATANGWPDENEYVTAHDLARIAEATIEQHPDLYERFYTLDEFTYGETMSGEPITQSNRNPILGRVQGADGLKTGHTEAAGYGFTGSAERDGRRLVMVIAGLQSQSDRRDEATRFMEWGFNAFEGVQIEPGKIIAAAPVFGGAESEVGLTLPEGASITVPAAITSGVEARIVYESPLPAPLAAGDQVGELHIKAGSLPEQVVPVVAAESVDEAGFFSRAFAGILGLLG